ncbi:MAG: PAS domain S-box protein, partial [Leptolyngbyaceae cyanobacterium RU_5_1]|nr:PAS domain S-box protein [Leptolyngbyaceae cyanobacterium RU_5_1]
MLSALFVHYFFIPPIHSFTTLSLSDLVRLAVFLLVTTIISLLNSNLQAARREIERLSDRQLQAREEQLRMTLQAARMGIWSWNMATEEITWSPEQERLFGFAPGTFDGRYETFEACLHLDDRDKLNQVVQTAIRERSVCIHEYRVVWADGSVHWLEGRGYTSYDQSGNPVRMTGTVMDIDDRKRTEAALLQSEERLRLIFQEMPVMLDAFDAAWNIIAWNHECERVTGFLAAEVMQNPTIMERFYPDAAYRQQMTVAWTERGNNYRNWEWDITCKDGSTRTISWSNISELFPVSGWASWGIGVDVTERKRAEAELRQLNVELEHRVVERTAELSEANDRLQKELLHRKRIEQALQQSELKFHAVFDQSFLFMGLLQPDGTIFEVNQRSDGLTVIMGEPFVGRPFWELAIWGREKQNHLKRVIEQVVAGEVMHLEMDIHALDGSLLQIDGNFVTHDVTVKAVKNAAGQVMFLTMEGWDISNLKRIEKSLQQSEERLQFAMEASRDGLWDWNIETGDVYHSPQYLEMLGYAASDLGELGLNFQRWQQLIHPEDKASVFEQLNAHLQNASIQYAIDYRVRTKSGDWKWVADYGKVVVRDLQGQPLRMIGTYRDISDRKQAEASLHEFNRRWQSLLDNVQLIVVQVTHAGTIDYVNPFFLTLTGYAAAEVLGKSWFALFLPSYLRPQMKTVFQEVLEQDFHPYYQNPIVTRTGEERMIAWNNTLLRDGQGKPIGTISIGEDITDRHNLERMKAEFLSAVSHELRTPLTSISGALELLATGLLQPQSERGQQTIQIAYTETDRLTRLVNDILDLERLESGKIRLEKHSCNLSDLMIRAADFMQLAADQSTITLSVTPLAVELEADSDRILQVLTNLLSNAIKFSEAGSVVWLSARVGNGEDGEEWGDGGDGEERTSSSSPHP